MLPARKQCAHCGFKRQAKAYASPRARVCMTCQKKARQSTSRDAHLRREYGITLEEYARMLLSQDASCAVCHEPRRGNLDVDHDHAYEKELLGEGVEPLQARRRSIRGLVCRRCNRRLLPSLERNPEIAHSAFSYLTGPTYGFA